MNKDERAVVAEHVRAEYDKLLFQQPTTYVAKHAQADPEGWHDAMCELIAADPKRLQEIVEKAGKDAGGCTGFTLIEMAIVLVIIGLIVGAVLVGQDLVRASEVRATITQIEKYNTAANTFYGKYGALPGDLNAQVANMFGFVTRAGGEGRGDGNGLIEGYDYSHNSVDLVMGGEPALFWEDLSSAGLVEGSFTAPGDAAPSGLSFDGVVPAAKVGNVHIAVYSTNGFNFFVTISDGPSGGCTASQFDAYGQWCGAMSLTVIQASAIDQKLDDGVATTGNVQANYLSGPYSGPLLMDVKSAPHYSYALPTTCYDTTSNQYSITQSGGSGRNCALSFKIQAGD